MRRALMCLVAGVVFLVGYCQGAEKEAKPNSGGGYLFMHMTSDDYGRLYYSVSEDGQHWRQINDGKRVFEKYRGHPDIMKGHDGRYYLAGNPSDREKSDICIWVTDDFLNWELVTKFLPGIHETFPEYRKPTRWHGAPKMFYDEDSKRYLITWHSTKGRSLNEHPEIHWARMRTFYILTKDFKEFTKPKKLFNRFDMATIDVIVRKEGDIYYAIIKDEKYPTFDWPTGKTIRICKSRNLTGPWSEPGLPLSPNFHEAPTLLRREDDRGWNIWYERYPGKGYSYSTASSLEGPWYMEYCMKYSVPGKARHGCMIELNEKLYQGVLKAFDSKEGKND